MEAEQKAKLLKILFWRFVCEHGAWKILLGEYADQNFSQTFYVTSPKHCKVSDLLAPQLHFYRGNWENAPSDIFACVHHVVSALSGLPQMTLKVHEACFRSLSEHHTMYKMQREWTAGRTWQMKRTGRTTSRPVILARTRTELRAPKKSSCFWISGAREKEWTWNIVVMHLVSELQANWRVCNMIGEVNDAHSFN